MSPFAAMTTLNIVVGILFIIAAVVLVVLGGVAAAGKLPGNKAIGLRVPEVRKEERIWVQAHRVVGPFWILAGVGMGIGAAFSFIAHGWLWVAPVIAFVAGLVALSIGGNYGAKTAALIDEQLTAEAESAAPSKPAPAVDVDALRRAAGKADER